MPHNPDIYLLYEYMQKIPFTFRVKVRLDEPVDADILNRKAQEAISRYPYFSVEIGLDEGGMYGTSVRRLTSPPWKRLFTSM